MSERDRIVAWLRREAAEFNEDTLIDAKARAICLGFAEMIEAGEHLKRPDPTIPASEWVKTPSVGY